MRTCTCLGSLAILAGVVLSGCASNGTETPVPVDQLPPAVRATLDREALGGEVTESEYEIKNGAKVYSFDVMINGKEYDMDIGENGELLGKKLADQAPADPRTGSGATQMRRDLKNAGVRNER